MVVESVWFLEEWGAMPVCLSRIRPFAVEEAAGTKGRSTGRWARRRKMHVWMCAKKDCAGSGVAGLESVVSATQG